MDLQTVLNVFATDVFRNQADRDYIAARALWRLDLREQFLWSGLQAFEKYLKAVLLFNGRSARYPGQPPRTKEGEFRHNLPKLWTAVLEMDDLDMQPPPSFAATLGQFHDKGDNRYLSRSTFSRDEWLHSMDEGVWYIRRYTQFIRVTHALGGIPIPGFFAAMVAHLRDPAHARAPSRFRPLHGELEKVLARPRTDLARAALVWNNAHFGSQCRRRMRPLLGSSSEIPPQEREWFVDEAWHARVKDYVRL